MFTLKTYVDVCRRFASLKIVEEIVEPKEHTEEKETAECVLHLVEMNKMK